MLCLKEHLKEAVTEVVYVLLDQELALIRSIVRQICPFEQSLERLTVCLDCKPDADYDQVLVVLSISTFLTVITSSCHHHVLS